MSRTRTLRGRFSQGNGHGFHRQRRLTRFCTELREQGECIERLSKEEHDLKQVHHAVSEIRESMVVATC